ncbi:MAG: hypothetical protein ABUL77_01780 [Bacteroidota bacterium]
MAAGAVVLATLAGGALLAVAMSVYPGGNVVDPGAAGHSLWFNFLCDLTNDVAVNGCSNHATAPLARAALLVLSVAVAAFWLAVPSCFAERRAYGRLVTPLGLLSVAGLLAVPVAAGSLHQIAIFAAAVPGLLAGILAIIGITRGGHAWALMTVGSASVGLALLDAVLYARSFMDHPRVVSAALPLFQRLALFSMVAWMAAVAVRVLRTRGTRR